MCFVLISTSPSLLLEEIAIFKRFQLSALLHFSPRWRLFLWVTAEVKAQLLCSRFVHSRKGFAFQPYDVRKLHEPLSVPWHIWPVGGCLRGGRHKLTRRAETLLRPIIYGQVPGHGDAVVLKGQVGWLVSLVVGPTQSHRREQVKAYLAVGLGVVDWRAVFGRLQLVCIKACEGKIAHGWLQNVQFSLRWDKATSCCNYREATGNSCWTKKHFFIHRVHWERKECFLHTSSFHPATF